MADAVIVAEARALAEEALVSLPRRLGHVRCVASAAAQLPLSIPERDSVLAAAWLHDTGYAPGWVATGFHPLDGARRLRELGWPAAVVSLVAYHSGAEWESRQRNLDVELAELVRPDQQLLDLVTFADMTSSPDGERVSVEQRLTEILDRYADTDPVHRAVTESGPYLTLAVRRTVELYDLPDKGF